MHGIPMSSVAPFGVIVTTCSRCPPWAGGEVVSVIVSFDSFRLRVPLVVLDPVSLLLTEPESTDLLSAMIVSALAFPLMVILLLVFAGSSGLIFSFEGGDGSGLTGLATSLPLSIADFVATFRFPEGAADAVDRIDVEEGVFRNAVDFSGVVFGFGTGLGVAFVVCADVFRARDVATDAVLASEGRRGRVTFDEGKAGAGVRGDRDVDVVERVEEVDILRDRPAMDSRAVLKAEDVVDVSLLPDIDNVDGGRGEVGGGRSVDWPEVPAAFLRIVDA